MCVDVIYYAYVRVGVCMWKCVTWDSGLSFYCVCQCFETTERTKWSTTTLNQGGSETDTRCIRILWLLSRGNLSGPLGVGETSQSMERWWRITKSRSFKSQNQAEQYNDKKRVRNVVMLHLLWGHTGLDWGSESVPVVNESSAAGSRYKQLWFHCWIIISTFSAQSRLSRTGS